jgi:hypothetical protein
MRMGEDEMRNWQKGIHSLVPPTAVATSAAFVPSCSQLLGGPTIQALPEFKRTAPSACAKVPLFLAGTLVQLQPSG